MEEIQDILIKAKNCVEANEFEQAISDYQKAIDLDPNHVEANFMLGEVYHQMGNLPKALGAYIKVCDLQPDHAKAQVKIEMINTILDYFNKDMHNP